MMTPPPYMPLPGLVPLQHVSGPPAMPRPAPGCAVCARLDTERRPEAHGGDTEKAARFAGYYMAHHFTRH
ncbi:hypothetical protein I5Q34_18840 [Streptomyces sp. AV19]|uniref:hypothetical protein n=1 Tax=Streptomyces sp. AV19 TaxID=2793068 RepID=UPI0018FE64A9|nr:hypothetical protein [Streptomyces sp. AV19]MBH1936307.1 hypothetical protein [Streptomyces sp. AV19]MDG4532344.1 hypothetical protein [Streptomyces sp. AV19]